MSQFSAILFDHLKKISLFGENPILLFFSFLLVVVFLYRQKHFRTAIVALLTSFSYLYSLYLKQIFRLPRPVTATREFHNFDLYGFPSSHVVFYMAFWGFVLYLTYKYSKEAKLYLHTLRWLSIYLILSIGASRVVLGMHFVRDVIAGYFFGGVFLLLFIWLDRKISEVFPKNKVKDD